MDYFQEFNVKKKYGVVAVLDALGTKGIWRGRSSNTIINKWDTLITSYKKSISKKSRRKSCDISFHAFSDTVIITFTGSDPNNILITAGSEISSFVLFALSRRIFFRGCLSYGKIFVGDQIIIGSAIDEAAQYYELSNWIGVFLTPSAIDVIRKPSFQKLIKLKQNEDYFVKYDIPLKTKIKRNGYALNIKRDYELLHLVTMLHLRKILPKQPETLLKREMKKISDPRILRKWKNTLKFFETNNSVPLKQILNKQI